MQNVYNEVNTLDKKCLTKYFLSCVFYTKVC